MIMSEEMPENRSIKACWILFRQCPNLYFIFYFFMYFSECKWTCTIVFSMICSKFCIWRLWIL